MISSLRADGGYQKAAALGIAQHATVSRRDSPMTDIRYATSFRRVPSIALLPFVLITFGVTWSITGLYVFFPERAAAWLGEISGTHPAFFVATWGPAIAGCAVVLYFAGSSGFKAYLSRIRLWRCSIGWAAFLIIGLPLVFIAGSIVQGGPLLAPLPPEGIGAVLAAMVIMLFLGPIEELGWRGVAQPLLQRHMAPLWAGLLIGTTWGIWHLPAFFLAGTLQSEWGFLPFLLGNIALAVLVTPLFNDSRGSILLPLLFHWQLINPFWPDARPWDTWILVAVAVIVVWLKRETMLTGAAAVTEVLPQREDGALP
jgi:membrane protease YdiL (CAAX protease family)